MLREELDRAIIEASSVAITIFITIGLFFAERIGPEGLILAFWPSMLFTIAIISATLSLNEWHEDSCHRLAVRTFILGWSIIFVLAITTWISVQLLPWLKKLWS